jgi:uncharacterized protein YigE (DUF2233 family)
MGHPAMEGPGMIRPKASSSGLLSSGILLLLALLAASAQAATRFQPAGEGVAVAHDTFDEPWSVHVVRVDRTHTRYRFLPTLGQQDRIGLNTLSDQVAQVPRSAGTVVAAINGDFYSTENEPMPGDPRGLFISQGQLVSSPIDRDCFWIGTNGNPSIGTVRSRFALTVGESDVEEFTLNTDFDGRNTVLLTAAANGSLGEDARLGWIVTAGSGPWLPLAVGTTISGVVKDRLSPKTEGLATNELLLLPSVNLRPAVKPGATVRISTATEPRLTGVRTALGGGPALLVSGQPTSMRATKSRERHPRSALGWNSTHWFLVVVDGRQAGLSVGMNLPELADYLKELGCTEAINLDGGGSTELIQGGRILNQPCYGHERRTATGLMVVQSAPEGSEATSR